MLKIMLVVDNSADEEFLRTVLERLEFKVISIKKGGNFSEQLIDHFPDLVFASTLGTNEKILSSLAKIKEARGKPKLVFVRQEKETAPLNAEQKRVIDGVLYTPIDPFKLMNLLASATEEDIKTLRQRYNQGLQTNSTKDSHVITGGESQESSESSVLDSKHDYGDTKLMGDQGGKPEQKIRFAKGSSSYDSDESLLKKPTTGKEAKQHLISDPERKAKYEQICANLPKVDKFKRNIDVSKMKQLQEQQAKQVQEDKSVKENRKHFIKTLFSTQPSDVKK